MAFKHEVTQKDIDKWKEEKGEVFEMEFEDGKHFYLHLPNRITTKLVMECMARSAVMDAADVVVKNCWLKGDQEIKDDIGKYHITIAKQVEKILEVKDASLKKL